MLNPLLHHIQKTESSRFSLTIEKKEDGSISITHSERVPFHHNEAILTCYPNGQIGHTITTYDSQHGVRNKQLFGGNNPAAVAEISQLYDALQARDAGFNLRGRLGEADVEKLDAAWRRIARSLPKLDRELNDISQITKPDIIYANRTLKCDNVLGGTGANIQLNMNGLGGIVLRRQRKNFMGETRQTLTLEESGAITLETIHLNKQGAPASRKYQSAESSPDTALFRDLYVDLCKRDLAYGLEGALEGKSFRELNKVMDRASQRLPTEQQLAR